MTTHRNDAVVPSRNSLTASPDSSRLDYNAYVNSNRDSYASSETAESSKAASQRQSLLDDTQEDGDRNDATKERSNIGRGSHRSHRSRTNGGFLLSTSTFDPPSRDITPPKSTANHISNGEYKGKAVLRVGEKKHKKRKSDLGLSRQGSPLAEHVATLPGDDHERESALKNELEKEGQPIGQPSAVMLDVDSAQIVNLALNLSESRKNAARRLVSNPLPSPVGGFSESMAGGSMRYHMQQQQRRSSRNVSPKPERGERHFSTSSRIPSGQRLNVPFQADYDQMEVGYHFSPSTLARAEKAKEALELMSHYRELLQYLPQLKPQKLDRATTASTLGSTNGSPVVSQQYRQSSGSSGQRPLGRQYNPLQYIRNRKVRARTSKSIDGQAQGFSDLDKVLPWVQEVSRESMLPDYQEADCLILPALHNDIANDNTQTSPRSTMSKQTTPARTRRPRIDWVIEPADMLADVYWLEQEDNKKLIEDRFGRRIFPSQMELRRPISRQEIGQSERSQEKDQPDVPEQVTKDNHDKQLPEFKSVRQDSENFAEKGASRAKEKLRHARDAALQHTHHGSGRNVRHFLKSHSKSDSSSSDSDSDRQTRRKRSGTADTDRGKQILEKQLSRMLENDKQAREGEGDPEHQRRRDAIVLDSGKSSIRNSTKDVASKASPSHSRSASIINQSQRDSIMYSSSARASLEVPRKNNRGSIDLDYDSTAPSSPDIRARQGGNSHIPSISMSLSPPHSRQTSPSRSALSKIKARIRPHHGRNQRSDHSLVNDAHILDEEDHTHQEDTVEPRRRSISPVKGRVGTHNDELRSNEVRMDQGYKERTEDPSGIRGFLKSARHPVNRVSDIIWKKDAHSVPDLSSGYSSENSDIEAPPVNHLAKRSTDELYGVTKFDALAEAFPPKEKPSYLGTMPTFTSSAEIRGRPAHVRDKQAASGSLSDIREDRIKRTSMTQSSAQTKIDKPLPKPEFNLPDWKRRGSIASGGRRYSDLEDGQESESRLDAILGLPGKQRAGMKLITGLTGLDANNRRPSLQGKRQWSLSSQVMSVTHDQTTRREIARIRALLLSSGIKAREITNRAMAPIDLLQEKSLYSDLGSLTSTPIPPTIRYQKHNIASQLLSEDILLSERIWRESADVFRTTTVPTMHNSIEALQSRLTNTLTPLTREAADEADEVSKDLVTSQTLNVKRINEKIERMIRTRKRRFRWLRRGGWVLVEWTLVGVMWYVWFLVVLCRIVFGIGRGVVGSVRWLLFM